MPPLYTPSNSRQVTGPEWRTANIPASSTISPTPYTGINWQVPYALLVDGAAFDCNGTIPVGSTTLLVKMSINGGADVTIFGIAAGDSFGVKPIGPFQLAAGDRILVRFVTDAGWTGVTADPQVSLIWTPL